MKRPFVLRHICCRDRKTFLSSHPTCEQLLIVGSSDLKGVGCVWLRHLRGVNTHHHLMTWHVNGKRQTSCVHVLSSLSLSLSLSFLPLFLLLLSLTGQASPSPVFLDPL